MTKAEINKLLKLGEGLTTEFKQSVSHLGREICALANASGGYVLIGVSDEGKITGINNLNKTKSEIQSIARTMDPPLALDIKAVDQVSVPSGANKPYSVNGKFYLREAANTQQMKRDELREFFFKEGLIRFDEQPCFNFDWQKDFSAKKYKAFIKAAKISATMKREDVLRNLRLLKDGEITNAGALLFSKQLDKYFRQAHLSCVLFRGTSKAKILDQKVYTQGLVENYHHGLAYLESHLNTEYIIRGGPREEVLELPETALREALLNALAHRDYHLPGHVQINIFQDRVEIVNPGGLVAGLKPKDLGRASMPRNGLLFAMLHRMELVENVGSGIKRMRQDLKALGLKAPKIEVEESWFAISFKRKKLATPSLVKGQGVNGGVNGGVGGVNRALDFIKQHPGRRTPELAKELQVPIKTAEKWVEQLRKQEKVEFRGNPKTGGYFSLVGGVSGGVNQVLEYIHQHPGRRITQISEALEVPVKTLEKWVAKLRRQGKVEFRGSSRSGGYWLL